MCTLSWVMEPEGYSLWFNRDELHTRALEFPPTARETSSGVAWLAPTDPESGGTWLMTNAYGVTCALLNRYPVVAGKAAQNEVEPRPSRGNLVPRAADARTARAAVEALRGGSLEGTPGFQAVAVDASGGVAELQWNGLVGHERESNQVVPPLTSSSYCSAEVEAARLARFPSRPTPDSLCAYHHDHNPNEGAVSVNMCRSDASTRSICHVWVSATETVLDYEPQTWPRRPLRARSRHQLARWRSIAPVR